MKMKLFSQIFDSIYVGRANPSSTPGNASGSRADRACSAERANGVHLSQENKVSSETLFGKLFRENAKGMQRLFLKPVLVEKNTCGFINQIAQSNSRNFL